MDSHVMTCVCLRCMAKRKLHGRVRGGRPLVFPWQSVVWICIVALVALRGGRNGACNCDIAVEKATAMIERSALNPDLLLHVLGVSLQNRPLSRIAAKVIHEN